jgi:hypothetical protein
MAWKDRSANPTIARTWATPRGASPRKNILDIPLSFALRHTPSHCKGATDHNGPSWRRLRRAYQNTAVGLVALKAREGVATARSRLPSHPLNRIARRRDATFDSEERSMSVLFGPVVQQGYIVPDIQAAMQHWIARGVGPFFIENLRGYPGIYRGEEAKFDLDAAFAYSGDQQIEVIQPLDDSPSIYSGYLRHHPTGGLQHLAVWVDDIEAKRAELEAAGHAYDVVQRYGDRHAYLDSVDSPGVMIQLMARNAVIDELFDIIKEGSVGWDGETDPIRQIDWSSGRPIAGRS